MRFPVRSLLTLVLLSVPAGQHAQEPQPVSPPTVYGPVDTEGVDTVVPAPVAIPDALDRAASLASASHPAVAATQAEARALEYDYRGTKSLRYPSVSVEALAATRGSSFADEDGLALNAVVEQPVWTGGRINGQIDRAEASLQAGVSRVEEARFGIMSRVISAYYGYVLADKRHGVLESSLAEHNRLLGSIGRRVEQEVSPRADLTLGQSRTAQVEFELASVAEARESARVILSELTGGADIVPTLPPPSIAETLPPEDVALDEALGCSPALATLTHQVRVAEAESDVARAQLRPRVLVQLSQNEITGTRAAAVLRAQLGNGVSQFRAIDAADARIQRALAEFGDAERSLREQIRRDYVLVRAANRRIATGTLAADAAAQIVESYQRQFIAGRRSWLDVMNATREAASAQLSEADARVASAEATARILALTCRWRPDVRRQGEK